MPDYSGQPADRCASSPAVHHSRVVRQFARRDPRFAGKEFEEAEKDLEGDWLNVRLPGDDWQAARVYAREGFERGREIGISGSGGVIGATPSHERLSFADPVPGNIDPTAPDSPEQRGSL